MTTGEKKNLECAACGKEARAWLWPDDGEQGYGLALIREDGKQLAALPVCEECYDTEIGRHAGHAEMVGQARPDVPRRHRKPS